MIRKKLVINGVARDLVLDGSETLAKLLRERLLLTGCKIGCGEGHCGACNVIVDGKVTRSCVTKVTRLKARCTTCTRFRSRGWQTAVPSAASVRPDL